MHIFLFSNLFWNNKKMKSKCTISNKADFIKAIGQKFEKDFTKIQPQILKTARIRTPILSKYTPIKTQNNIFSKTRNLSTDRPRHSLSGSKEKNDKNTSFMKSMQSAKKDSALEKIDKIKFRLDMIRKTFNNISQNNIRKEAEFYNFEQNSPESIENNDYNFANKTSLKKEIWKKSGLRARTTIPQSRKFREKDEKDDFREKYTNFLYKICDYDKKYKENVKINENQINSPENYAKITEISSKIISESQEIFNQKFLDILLENNINNENLGIFEWAYENYFTKFQENCEISEYKNTLKNVFLYDMDNFQNFENNINLENINLYENLLKNYNLIFKKISYVLPFTSRSLHKLFIGFIKFIDKLQITKNEQINKLEMKIENQENLLKKAEILKTKLKIAMHEIDLTKYQLDIEEKLIEARTNTDNIAVKQINKEFSEIANCVNSQYQNLQNKFNNSLIETSEKIQSDSHLLKTDLVQTLEKIKTDITKSFESVKIKSENFKNVSVQVNSLENMRSDISYFEIVKHIEYMIFPKEMNFNIVNRNDIYYILDLLVKSNEFKNLQMNFSEPIFYRNLTEKNYLIEIIHKFLCENHTNPYKEFIAFYNNLKNCYEIQKDPISKNFLNLINFSNKSQILANCLSVVFIWAYKNWDNNMPVEKIDKFCGILQKYCNLDILLLILPEIKFIRENNEIIVSKINLMISKKYNLFQLEKIFKSVYKNITNLEFATIFTMIIEKFIENHLERLKKIYLNMDISGKGIEGKINIMKLISVVYNENDKESLEQIYNFILEEYVRQKLIKLKEKKIISQISNQIILKYKVFEEIFIKRLGIHTISQEIYTSFNNIFAK